MNEPRLQSKLKRFLIPKIKFGLSSLVATSGDLLLFSILADRFLSKSTSTLISRLFGMIINFILHKTFVFNLNRTLSHALGWSILISISGMALAWLIMYLVGDLEIWGGNKYYPKLLEVTSLFLFNFYFKRMAFEYRRPTRNNQESSI